MSERRVPPKLASIAIAMSIVLPGHVCASSEAQAVAACSPAYSERDVINGLVIRTDCGLPASVVQRLVAEPNRAVRRVKLTSNQRAAFARAANAMFAAMRSNAFENAAPLIAALAASVQKRPDADFFAIAQQWSTRYQRLLRDTSVTRTSDPIELDVDRAIGLLDLQSAANLLEVQLREADIPAELTAARHREAAIVEWLRFAPQRAIAHARAAYALRPNDVEFAETYADMLVELHQFPQAEPLYELLLTRYEALARERPDVWHARMARVFVKLGGLFAALRRRSDAEMAYLRALSVFWGLARSDPPAYAPAVAATFVDLGMLYRDDARLGDAVDVYREALTLQRALAERDRRTYETDLATTLNDLGVLYQALRRNDEAGSAYVDALAIQRRLVADNPAAYRPVLAKTLNNLGNLYSDMGKRPDAYLAYREALQIRRQLAGESIALSGADLARTLTNLGALYRVEGRSKEAQRAYVEALHIFHTLGSGKPNPADYRPDEARTLNNLGVLYSRTNRLREAENAYRRSVALYDLLLKEDPTTHLRDYALVLDNLAQLYGQTGRAREADAAKRKAAKMNEAANAQ
jgi:tetratricopeptide (TPR) repeat protein